MIYNSLQSEQPNCDFPITTHQQPVFHLGPYHNELTASRPICAVKHCRAESVVRWGTTREYSGAPGFFFWIGFWIAESFQMDGKF